jgi:hypothetical protein
MKSHTKVTALLAAALFLGSLGRAVQIHGNLQAQPAESQAASQNPSTPQKSQPAPATSSRLTIQVTAGEKNEPVDSASVYVKYIQEHKLRKDKRVEMNVKTNRDGIAHVPEPPKGKVLIQIIAPGWKPFGKWFEIEDLSQPIQIHLEKPPRWY